MGGLQSLLHGAVSVPDALEGSHIIQKLPHGQLLIKAEGLGQIAEVGLHLGFLLEQWFPVYGDASRGGQKLGHQQLHQSGFASSVGSQQPHKVGALQLQLNAV